MDFQLVRSTLLKEFNDNDISYAVIGGFALGLWNVTRATIDMDFLLLVDDLPKAESVLERFAFRRTHKSANVAQYVSDLAPYGQVDILIAFRKISRSMLSRRVEKQLGESYTAYTLIPEDLIGLKLQALVNDPSREQLERSDFKILLATLKKNERPIDWDLLLEYFNLFDRADLLAELRAIYDEID